MIDLQEAYRLWFRIRHTEEELARRYPEGKMRCPMHLSIGQEAAAVGVMMALNPADHVFSNHRCHAHYLAKGGNLKAMIAELYGRPDGCAGGAGGSMHLVDESVGFMGTSPIVGSGIAVALGAAMAFQRDGSGRRAVVFVGDAGPETGTFYESINMAALWHLPILFVVENNGYSTQTPLNKRQPERSLMAIAHAMDIQGFREPFEEPSPSIPAIWQRAMRLLSGRNLPALLEIPVYRFRTHVGPEYDWDLGLEYRTQQEVEFYMRLDEEHIAGLRSSLTGDQVAMIEHDVNNRITEAFDGTAALAT
mgnify:FL=1